jgi:hypothetical protein
MSTKLFLVATIVVAAMLVVTNIFMIVTSPVHAVSNLIMLVLLILFSVLYGERKEKEKYDYDRENPNALVHGDLIAGTVYASDPGNTPGLGWIN